MRPKVAEPLKLHQIGIWRQLGDKRKRLCADKLRQIVHDLVSALWLSLLWAVWLAGRPPVPLVGCLALPLLRVAPTAEQGIPLLKELKTRIPVIFDDIEV